MPSNNDNIFKTIHKRDVLRPLWLSISESAKISGLSTKTIRRAIFAKKLSYKIIKNRYFINLRSLLVFIHSKAKLRNKFYFNGFGQYIDKLIINQ